MMCLLFIAVKAACRSVFLGLLSVKGSKQRQPTSLLRTAVRRRLMMIEANVAIRVKS